MSAGSTAAVPTRTRRDLSVKPVSQWQVIQSEWIKLSTLRSTWYTLAFAVAGVIVVGAVASWAVESQWDSLNESVRATFDPIDLSLGGVMLAQLIIAVLGVLLVTGEYANGMIRVSLAAVPHRLLLLRGKLLVSAVISAVAAIPACLIAFGVGQTLPGDHGATLSSPHALRAVFGSAFYLVAIAVLASSIGFVVRSTAAGIGTILGLLLVLPLVLQILPFDWLSDLLRYLPSNAGTALSSSRAGAAALSPFWGFVTLCAWLAVAVVAAATTLQRRDA